MRNVGHPFRGASFRGAAVATTIVAILAAAPASAQINGQVSVIADAFPDIDPAAGSQPVTEMRVRLFAERYATLGPHLRIALGGYVDGLIADRTSTGGHGTTRDVIVRPADLFVDFVTSRFDVRAGSARLVWGRLDEFQPTDVVNPIDLSRFLMEGRSEARLPVGLVRGRIFLPRSTTIEGVVVPVFRRGTFDQLDEPTSPFNLTLVDGTPERGALRDLPAPEGGALRSIPRIRDEPDFGTQSLQGGVRLTSTTSRVDWAVSAYRGIRAFPISTLTTPIVGADPQVGPSAIPPFVIRESFSRFTMIGGDFETVRGLWGVRGEIAAFVDDELQSTLGARGVPGHSVSAGVGIDRRAGDYRVAGNILWSWSGVDNDDPAGQVFAGDDEVERTDLAIVLAADRAFARETRTVRLFAVYDPADATTFARVIAAVSIRDNVWVEGSAALFTGSSLDVIGRLTHRDFAYARLKVFF